MCHNTQVVLWGSEEEAGSDCNLKCHTLHLVLLFSILFNIPRDLVLDLESLTNLCQFEHPFY